MAAVIYPLTLPGPGLSEVTPSERRVHSDLAGPLKLRDTQQDYLGTQTVEWFFSAAEAEIFQEWWTDTLTQGGAWFAATWPVPLGWVSAVRRFIGDPQWTHISGGYWTVKAQVTVRGRGMAPVQPDPAYAVFKRASSMDFFTGTLTNQDRTFAFANASSTFASLIVTSPTLQYTTTLTEPKYWELVIEGNQDYGYVIGVIDCDKFVTGTYPINPFAVGVFALTTINYFGGVLGVINNGSNSSDAAYVFGVGDVIGVAFAPNTGKLWFSKNGVWFKGGNPSAGTAQNLTCPNTDGRYVPYISMYSKGNLSLNYGISCRVGVPPINSGSIPFGFFPWG